MTARFKIFKTLTSINLFVTGFFLMNCLMALLMGQVMVGLLLGVFLGAIGTHSVLSIALQRSLMDTSLNLKESTPGGIRIMGGIALIFALLLLLTGLAFVADQSIFMENIKLSQQQYGQEMATEISAQQMMFSIAIIIIYGAMIVVNCLLSFSFLKQWLHRGHEKKEEEIL